MKKLLFLGFVVALSSNTLYAHEAEELNQVTEKFCNYFFDKFEINRPSLQEMCELIVIVESDVALEELRTCVDALNNETRLLLKQRSPADQLLEAMIMGQGMLLNAFASLYYKKVAQNAQVLCKSCTTSALLLFDALQKENTQEISALARGLGSLYPELGVNEQCAYNTHMDNLRYRYQSLVKYADV